MIGALPAGNHPALLLEVIDNYNIYDFTWLFARVLHLSMEQLQKGIQNKLFVEHFH